MNPFNDDDDVPPPPPQNNQGGDNMTLDEINSNYTPPQIQSQSQEDTATLQEWDRAAKRYQQETSMTTADDTEETIDDDPLASPGNSSLNSYGGGGWSLAAGLVDEHGSICFVTEEEEDEEEENQRTSSPRESHIKKHGLSMVKEEDTSNTTSKGNTTSTLFDDVDLEAFPGNLPTAAIQKNGSFSPKTMGTYNSKSSDNDGSTGWYKGNIVSRILQEVQTNRKIRFRVAVGISLVLVSSCLVAIAMAGSKSKVKQYKQNTAGASDLSELLLGLESDEVEEVTTTLMPSLIPTTTPSSSPIDKVKTKLPSKSPVTNKPTYEPTQFPTYILTSQSPTYVPTSAWPTVSPSAHPSTKLPSYSPSLLPITPYPTMNCVDSYGEYMTYNDKARTCEWLDNGHNGAQSERKDLNCLNSQLGYECPFTCRLYNGCLEYLLALPEETVSISTSECVDKDGTFMSEGNVPRECSWFEEDPTTAPTKKNLNCGNPSVPPTELGLNCRASCMGYNDCRHDGEERISPHPLAGLDISLIDYGGEDDEDSPTLFPSSIEPTFVWERCRDKDGEYLTHMGTLRSCRWFNRDDVEEKMRLNCGITPIGKKCMATCPCDTQLMQRNSQLVPTMVPTSGEPTPHPATKGIYTNEGVLTLSTLADASTSQKYYDTNEGDSKRLNVAYEDGRLKAKQSLLLFDLSYMAKTLPVVSLAKLRIYCVVGSESGAAGIVLKKMASTTNFTEYNVTWSTMPGGDGQDEPVVAFVDTLESNQWYDIDVTAAVLDAIKNQESYLGLRLTSDGSDSIDVYFGSRERLNEPPTLVVDSRTGDPTYQPTDYPTYFPSMAPGKFSLHHFDCMNRKGKFTTHEGEREPCSWLEVGNGALKKEMNCKDLSSEAAFFCQDSCSAYNGCDDLHCTDMSGMYTSHLGWEAECSWLLTGNGALKLDMNCGSEQNPITELGLRCQATCSGYNECGSVA